ncbi:glycosyltransferase family 2 protein [Arcanobacterium phocisimile]|uniref:glycosyltransferase family 2 protein n=1 Tax=Arcanobacterium phocisimile TaxID=1302235 RepID=UPI001EF855EE|nr:glycosyltransferase family 2 protein [Arcanobacterium phocisimile]
MNVTGWSEKLAQESWLIVPLYNEDQVIKGVMEEARKTFPNIVCVNDGSSDDSAAQARLAGVDVVEHPINLGQGAALRTGLDYALLQPNAKYFVTFDSDGQHRVVDAQKMVVRLATEPIDVVIGSRFLDDRTNAGFLKRIVLKAAVFFQRLTTGMQLTDAHNGLRALNQNAAKNIRISQNRMAHASEIVSEIAEHKLRYVEEPVFIVYTDYSLSKGQSLWNSVNILSDLMFK